ncbi:MAG: DUF342 domain-containing protein [Desulfobacteraceae bacterium]|nr:DUF342 domain-containing protein [Desulfobacteraceae bacterium]
MNKKITPKVLIAEEDKTATKLARTIFAAAGWEVTITNTGIDALTLLESSGKSPFALFISGFNVKRQHGIDLLERAKKVSPITQRMLWIPFDKPEALVAAINTANINACITYPLKKGELVQQAENCLKQFLQSKKRQKFKALIARHNQKMYKVAQNLMKKDSSHKLLLDEKKSKILQLKFKQRQMDRADKLSVNISLSELIDYKQLPKDPEILLKLFLWICNSLRNMIKSLAAKHQIGWMPQDTDKILEGEIRPYSHSSLLEEMLKTGYILALDVDIEEKEEEPSFDQVVLQQEDTIEEYLDLIVSDDKTKAGLVKKKDPDKDDFLTLEKVTNFLEENCICYGLVEEEEIEKWVLKATKKDKQFIVAQAIAPQMSKDGSIQYFFETEYTNPGKVRDDGSIDFHDRGDVPFVYKFDLLAKKIPAVTGKAGVSVYGMEIAVPEFTDPSFSSGTGTHFSDNKLEIYSNQNGQPHLDAMGVITVNPEFLVKGDVDFETGNIDFDGNIVVRGTVKEGFTVKAVNLTAKEIEGATLFLSGDLNVSSGITDANIKTVGNIHTKFIHNSQVLGFGDFTVQKEIIDSNILLSGKCIVSTGHILASQITAKKGVEAGSVGNPSSKPPKLKVGVEEHIEEMIKKNKLALETNLTTIEEMQGAVKAFEAKEMELDKTASEKAFIQDNCQHELQEMKKKYLDMKSTSNTVGARQATNSMKSLLAKAKDAEDKLQSIFERQDELAHEIKVIKDQINIFEEKNIILIDEKKSLADYKSKADPDPTVIVNKTITQDTIIQATSSSLTLKEDEKNCKIEEILVNEGGKQFHEVRISSLK